MDDEGLKPSLDIPPDLIRLYNIEREVVSRPLSEDEKRGFGKAKRRKPNPCPFIKFEDLNNKTEKDILDCNAEHPAESIGFKWEF